MNVLHVIDWGTSTDALEMLGLLVKRYGGARHRVLVLGHWGMGEEAVRAGVPEEWVSYGRSMGWCDPAGWRAVGEAIKREEPTHLHAWGLAAAAAGTVQTRFKGARILTLAQVPGEKGGGGGLKLLRILTERARKGEGAERRGWRVTVSSSSIWRAVVGAGVQEERVRRIRPGVAMGEATGVGKFLLRQEWGIGEGDGPVILLGGPSAGVGVRGARHDHGLWAAGILETMYPRTRILLQEGNPRLVGEDRAVDFLRAMRRPETVVRVGHEEKFSRLVQAADILLVSADQPIPTGTILWAMAASVPVIGTAIECVAELVAQGETGMLARAGKPRALTQRLEQFMADATLRWPLTDKARAMVFEEFKVGRMVEEFGEVYGENDCVGVGEG